MNPAISYFAIGAATIVSMVLGFVWYSKLLFGRQWQRLVGLSDDRMKSGMTVAMVGMLITAFIQNYALGHFIWYTKALTIMTGMQTGFWLWLGFIATVGLSQVFFAKQSVKLWMIASGYQLVMLLINGAILAVWR